MIFSHTYMYVCACIEYIDRQTDRRMFGSLNIIYFSLRLVPAQSRLEKGNIVLRHLVPHFFIKFWRLCVFSGGTQSRALPRYQSEKKLILRFFEWEQNPQPVAFTVTLCALMSHLFLLKLKKALQVNFSRENIL